MGEEPVGERDDTEQTTQVTATMNQHQLAQLRAAFPDARNDPERLRRAVWLVTTASSIRIDRDADEPE